MKYYSNIEGADTEKKKAKSGRKNYLKWLIVLLSGRYHYE